ncbi:MAG TPA: DNA alkylation repair protein [Candidatus Borkfalkia excrementipullorum]|nr:DNA alkylation repair protein [Candidatus Borkfalkia excrementipullorum]
MIAYEETLAELSAMKDEKYRVFNERIVNVPSGTSIGVRTPMLRDYAKKFVKREDFSFDELFQWPNDFYEIRLLKCLCVGYAKVPFAEKEELIEKCLPVIDGWGVCDLFCATLKEVEKHREEFLPNIERYIAMGTEFSQRFGYILLLGCYMEEEYLPVIFRLLGEAKTECYYTYMGAAWLLAEVLVKFYGEGVRYLKEGALDGRTKNKAIQKARESFRLTDEQKNYLKSLKN